MYYGTSLDRASQTVTSVSGALVSVGGVAAMPVAGGVAAGGTTVGAAATGAIGSSVAGGLAGAGAAVSTIPVAGWIVGGGLLTAAGIVGIVMAFRKKGRKPAMAAAQKLGVGGIAFAKEYASLVGKPLYKVERRMRVLEKKANNRKNPKRRNVAMDRLNAARMVISMKVGTPSGTQLDRGSPSSTPAAAELNTGYDLEELAPYAAAGVVGLVILRILTR